MVILDRKLLRDLRTMRGQVIAIVLIVACGVASLVTVVTAYRGLEGSLAAYYARYRMADVWAPVKRAPRKTALDLEKVPGVRRVDARIVFDVTIDLPGVPEPLSGRIVSAEEEGINGLHLTRGSWFEGEGVREVIVAERFANEHGLDVGDELRVVMNNKKEALRIVALALSPEFIYLIRGSAEILPDPKTFTVLWTTTDFAEAVFDFEDAANDFVALLDPRTSVQEAVEAFDDVLEPYGAFGAYAREDQLSHRFVSDEIEGLKGSATLTPAIFLGVAAFVLHMLMRRLVQTQRTQIGLLRAFGYTTRELAGHYLKIGLAVAVLGAAVGTGVGLWFAKGLAEIYRQFYNFPVLHFAADPVAIAGGWAASLAFGALGAIGSVRAVARLEPAEAMRPEAPRTFHRFFLERWPWLWRRMSFTSRVVLRNLARTKLRAAVTVVAVALGASILLLANFAVDSLQHLIDVQFRLQQRQDVRIGFHLERGRDALYELRRMDGVRAAEPELVVPVRLRHGWRERLTGLTGIESGDTLHVLLDADLAHVAPPRDGLLLSRKLAELLGVRAGDHVEVEVLYGERQRFLAPVEAVVEEYLGTFAYAELSRLSRWVGEASVMSGALLVIEPGREEAVGVRLKEMPAVAGVGFKERAVESFRDTLEQSQRIQGRILLAFAGIICFGVIYNTARISLAERARELGSLRVLGFTTREVNALLSSQSLLLTVVALVPGVALGAFFGWLLTVAYDTDLYRFPFVLQPESVVNTIGTVIAFTLLANLVVLRRVARIDIVETLKGRE